MPMIKLMSISTLKFHKVAIFDTWITQSPRIDAWIQDFPRFGIHRFTILLLHKSWFVPNCYVYVFKDQYNERYSENRDGNNKSNLNKFLSIFTLIFWTYLCWLSGSYFQVSNERAPILQSVAHWRFNLSPAMLETNATTQKILKKFRLTKNRGIWSSCTMRAQSSTTISCFWLSLKFPPSSVFSTQLSPSSTKHPLSSLWRTRRALGTFSTALKNSSLIWRTSRELWIQFRQTCS